MPSRRPERSQSGTRPDQGRRGEDSEMRGPPGDDVEVARAPEVERGGLPREDEQAPVRDVPRMAYQPPPSPPPPPPPAAPPANHLDNMALVPIPLQWDPLMRRSPRPYASSSGQGQQSPRDDVVPKPIIVEEVAEEPERQPILLGMAPAATQQEEVPAPRVEPDPVSRREQQGQLRPQTPFPHPLQPNRAEHFVSPSTFISNLHVGDSPQTKGSCSDPASPLGERDAGRRDGIGGIMGPDRDGGAEAVARGGESDILSSLDWGDE
jgi:hypothetical protein